MAEQLCLTPTFAAHCFYACDHIERADNPQDLHDAMERHYAAWHYTPHPADKASHRSGGPA